MVSTILLQYNKHLVETIMLSFTGSDALIIIVATNKE